ncbi:MAG: hypothetical protein JWL88_605 [Parcubacteria group bacterium]|nr:hypothetical protein [Parcubacteria group bacterium]
MPGRKSITQELKELFDADQADRIALHGNWDSTELNQKMREGDAVRLSRGREIYEGYKEGTVELSSDELVQLAVLFQHSRELDDYWKAHELGNDAGEEGKWIAAAAEDRWLLAKGEKQKWGTQFLNDTEQAPMLSDEESGITDEMRIDREIPPRSEQLAAHLKYSESED